MCSLTSFISIFLMNSMYYSICLFSVVCNIHFKQGKSICKLIHLLNLKSFTSCHVDLLET